MPVKFRHFNEYGLQVARVSDRFSPDWQVLFNVNRKEKLELLEGLQLRKPDTPLPKVTQVVAKC